MSEFRRIFNILRTDPRLKRSRIFLLIVLFLAVFGDFIANEKPLYCKVDGEVYFPAFREVFVDLGVMSWPESLAAGQWATAAYEGAIYTLIPYSPNTLDSKNGGFKGPFSKQDITSLLFRHWLGTDALGRDVAAGMIRGCRIALVVGLISMALALLVGVPLGAVAGYFGDRGLAMAWPGVVLFVALLLLATWYTLSWADHILSTRSWLLVICFLCVLWVIHQYLLKERYPAAWLWRVPVDSAVMRMIEVVRGIPALFILFGVLAVVDEPSLGTVVIILGLLRAPTVMRYIRAEAMKIRQLAFIRSARIIGLGNSQIILRHVIPNALGPVFITVAFGFAGSILLESALSFLGIGLSLDQISWGKLLSEARTNFSAWWLAILPGAAIFLTVASFNRIGEVLADAFSGVSLT